MRALIDGNIKYTDGAHNIVAYEIDGDGNVELVANSYRTDALVLYRHDGDPHDSLNWSRYAIDPSVGGSSPTTAIIKSIKFTLKEELLRAFAVEPQIRQSPGLNRLIKQGGMQQ